MVSHRPEGRHRSMQVTCAISVRLIGRRSDSCLGAVQLRIEQIDFCLLFDWREDFFKGRIVDLSAKEARTQGPGSFANRDRNRSSNINEMMVSIFDVSRGDGRSVHSSNRIVVVAVVVVVGS
jgi:hypothetical protein